MTGDDGVKEIQASDILKQVPSRRDVGEEPTPLQRVGYKLALFVLAYMVCASAVIFVVSFRCIQLPPFPVPPASASDPEHYKQLVEVYKAHVEIYQQLAKIQVERATQLFQLVVASTMLPAFTAILGYIFGSKKSGE